jgi:hypothetical protein
VYGCISRQIKHTNSDAQACGRVAKLTSTVNAQGE